MKKKKKKKKSKLGKFLYPASVIAVTAVCAYVLFPGFRELEDVRARVVELERAHQGKLADNDALKREVASMSTPEGIERAARRFLGAAKPDEIIFRFKPPAERRHVER
jgi:cell division protein FtsB